MEHRVLLRAATSRDAQTTREVLARAGIASRACDDMATLVREIDAGAGALILAEEAMGPAALQTLAAALQAQPPWSDLPLLLLARHGAESATVRELMEQLPNVTVIERPVRVAALVSALRSMLRARKRQYELRARLADLQRADQRKTEFLATLAHELRNPLAPLSNALELLSAAGLDSEARVRTHDMMRRQIRHMARLIDDLMEVSRITRGKIDLHPVTLSLQTVAADAVELSRPLIAAHAHELQLVLPAEALLVHGDPVRLAQVLSNLLNNAAKYTPRGGRVGLALRRDGASALIEVSDSGIGLESAMLGKVFDMFVQVSHAARIAQGGLGIGLTLVKNLVEMHGGRVEAASDGLDRGSTFSVRLPLLDSGAGSAAPVAPARALPPLARRVLIVDDNCDAADTLAECLRLSGATVGVAYGSAEALQRYAGQCWDAAVLDIGMPGMDGCQLAARLRQLPGGERLLLIAATGWGQYDDQQRLAAAGFDHHLLKPLDPDALVALLLGRSDA